jgi:hypothetical protein
MIERLFDLVKRKPSWRPRNLSSGRRNRIRRSGVYTGMKRDSVSLVAATVRTGLLVGFVLILILVLFPAAMAQAAGPR